MPASVPPVATFSHPNTAGPKYPAILANVFHKARPPACAGRGRLPRRDAVSGAVALHDDRAMQRQAKDRTPLTIPPPFSRGDRINVTPPIAKGIAVCSRLSLYLHVLVATGV
jgi:hypothetical protein